MSASLVGSEMCIRDSQSSSGLFGAVRCACGLLGALGETPPKALHELSGACLLYTSDAADDM
eukprot:12962457-Alexandrium_andersonii.AAC.1